MSPPASSGHHADGVAIALGLFVLVASLLWVLDTGGMTTRILQAFYRWRGSLLWPFGSERSYVSFMRYGGGVVLVLAVLLVVAGVIR